MAALEPITGVADALTNFANATADSESHRVVDDPNGRYLVTFRDSNAQPCQFKDVQGRLLTNDPSR